MSAQPPGVVGIVGSRAYPDLGRVRQVVTRLRPMTLVVSGGARGVDQVAVARAEEIGLPTKVFAAGWEEHGKRAGFLRNKALVEFLAAERGRLVAFHGNDPKTGEPSRGTAMTIGLAREAGVKVNIYRERSAEEEAGGQVPESLRSLVAHADEVAGKLQAATISQAKRQLAGVAERVRITLRDERDHLADKLRDGSAWLDAHPEHGRYDDTEQKWMAYLRSYEAVGDALERVETALATVAS